MSTPDLPTYGTTVYPENPSDDTAPAEPASDLDDLRAELTLAVDSLTEALVIPARPRYSVRFRTDFTARDLDAWRKRARDKTFTDGLDGGRYAALIVGGTARLILRDGQASWLPGEETVSFQSRELRDLVGAVDVVSAVRTLYGNREGDLDRTARRILVEAGYADTADTADTSDPS